MTLCHFFYFYLEGLVSLFEFLFIPLQVLNILLQELDLLSAFTLHLVQLIMDLQIFVGFFTDLALFILENLTSVNSSLQFLGLEIRSIRHLLIQVT